MNKPNLFISYCWDNKEEVEMLDRSIQLFFPEITIIRNTRDLRNGMNIKEYMRSIRQVDYAAINVV